MQELENFCHWFNSEIGSGNKIPSVVVDGEETTFGNAMQQSIIRHYSNDRQRGGLRMSSMGKPACVIALNHLGYSEPEPVGKSRFIFMTGDFFENALEIFLKMYGFNILDTQGTVTHNGITGHYDYVVEVDGRPVLVEAKTMSDNYSRQFQRGPDDVRGYMTQVALYRSGLGGDMDVAWLCLNKGNGEVFMIEPDYDELDVALLRVDNILSRIYKVEELDDVFKYFKVPPPRPEVYRGAQTGKHLVPTSMSYSVYKNALYKLNEEPNGYNKMTTYVEDFADTEHLKRGIEHLMKTGEIVHD